MTGGHRHPIGVIPAAMSIERIFRQRQDPSTWPPPPERPLVPASADDLLPAELIGVSPDALQPWIPPQREANEGWLPVAGGDG